MTSEAVRAGKTGPPATSSLWSRQPLLFIENQGQFHEDVEFVARQGVMTAFLTREGLAYDLNVAEADLLADLASQNSDQNAILLVGADGRGGVHRMQFFDF